MKIRILIADDIDDTRALLKQVVELDNEEFEVVGEARDGVEAVDIALKLKPDIILMDINMPNRNGLESTEIITSELPNCDVIIMSVQSDTEYLKTAMEAGAKGYILKPINHEEVTELIKKTYLKSSERRSHNVVTEEVLEEQIISFYSLKGGVGKSILALNSSIILADKLQKKVLLIDLDLHFGSISLLIDKHYEKTILDLVDDSMMDKYELIEPYLYSHSKNLDILFAPSSAEGADYISKEIINTFLEKVKGHYDLILIDTGVNFEEHTLLALDLSDTIYFVSSMEMSSIKNAKMGLKVMQSLNYSEDKVKILINKASEKYGVSKKDLKSVFESDVSNYIEEDLKNVRMSVNRGIALCSEHKHRNLKFYKSLLKMCKEIVMR